MNDTTTPAASQDAAARRDSLVGRLFQGTLGAFDLLGLYVGDRLGLYRALGEFGPLTSSELAEAARIDERCTREWLEQQAAGGILDADDIGASEKHRRYSIPAGHNEVLLDESSLNYMVPMARLLVACVRPADAVLQSFRTGEGVPYEQYGADLHEGQAGFTRPIFNNVLCTEWLPAIPAVHARLMSEPPARVADVACGEGASSIAIARAYPKVLVDGIDSDRASVEGANRSLADSGVDDRVTFHVRDAADFNAPRSYDLVYIHEALHDMSYPVDVLRACRTLLRDDGSVLVVDERVGDSFNAPGDDLERLYYGFSILHCLHVGMVGEQAAGTGTVMRPATVYRYAMEAGFSDFETLPIENDFYRLYRLIP